MAEDVASALAALARRAAGGGRRFSCAVPGGSVATSVFPRLARQDAPWAAVDVFLADERFVAPDHPDSNARLVRAHWLAPLGPDGPRLHAMPTAGLTLDEAAARASAKLSAVTGHPPRLDLIVLGVGPDGHVASLFPADQWRQRPEWVIPVRHAPKPPAERLSLGLAAISGAAAIWLVAFGRAKAAVVAEARHHPASTLPVAVVAACGPPVRWFLDDELLSAMP